MAFLKPNDKPQSPTAESQCNRDEQRREEIEQHSHGVTPQRANTKDAPLFTHSSKITPVEHPSRFVQPPPNDMPAGQHPGAAGR